MINKLKTPIIGALLCSFLALSACQRTPQTTQIDGPLTLWYPVVLTFDGPQVDETSATFRDYRLDVTFTHEKRSFTVPGYFAADGDAANTGADSGNKWRVKYTPDAEGKWKYSVSFLHGKDIAINLDSANGTPTDLHGNTGEFTISAADGNAPGFFSKGMLRYVGEHYLQHQGTGENFVKVGPGSPEDFLGYAEFDGTYDRGGSMDDTSLGEDGLHNYEPHIKDWKEGDPTWAGGKGKGIIGALNYLSSVGCNTLYNIIVTLNGDADTVWPWVDPVPYPEGEEPDFKYKRTKYKNLDTYDVSKLEQWDIVFSHMDRLGINHDVYLSEQESASILNGDQVGAERILFIREMAARFSHHLSWRWNIGEEPHSIRPPEMAAMMEYIQKINTYNHPVGHHCSGKHELRYPVYDPQLGNPAMTAAFAQINEDYHEEVLKYVEASREAGVKWVVANDEPNKILPGQDQLARNSLWKVLMAGGEGLDIYTAYDIPDYSDITIEDFRRLESIWTQLAHGRRFFQLPEVNRHLHEMTTQSDLVSDGYCFAKRGELYVIYSENASDLSLDLSETNGDFLVQWYDPTTGGSLQKGTIDKIVGGRLQALGNPPSSLKEWAVLVTSQK